MKDDKISKISRGIRWTYLSVIVSGLLQIAMLAIMARLLQPADFGAIASSLLVLKSGQTLVQSGYERAVVWVTDLTPRLECGLFWVSIATGGALTLLFFAIAHPVSIFFNDARVGACLESLAPMLILGSFALVPRGIMRKRYRFATLGLVDTGSYVVGFVFIGLPIALMGGGVWSLVAANLSQVVVQTSLSVYLQRPVLAQSFSRDDIAAPLKFGYSASGLGLIEFLDIHIPSIFIGRSLGIDALGVYNRAYTLIQLPLEQLGVSLTRVLYSSFAEAKHDLAEIGRIILPAMKYLCILIFPFALGGAVASNTVVAFVLGNSWNEAAPIFAILAASTAAAVAGNLLATLNEALYLTRRKTVLQMLCTLTLTIMLFWLAPLGLVGVAICVCVSRIMFFAGQFYLSFSHLGIPAGRVWVILGPGAGAAACVGLGVWGAEWVADKFSFGVPIRMLVDITVAGAIYFISVRIFVPELWRQFRSRLSHFASRRS